jgi:hypothetical protein
MPDKKDPGLGGSVKIPGTKKRVPVIGVVAVGGACIAAYVLLKGGNTAGADLSAAPADTGQTPSNDTIYTALTGAIEEISSRLAELEKQPASAAGPLGISGFAPAVSEIPVADVAAPAIGPSSVFTAVSASMPPSVAEQLGILPAGPSYRDLTKSFESLARSITKAATPAGSQNKLGDQIIAAATRVLNIPAGPTTPVSASMPPSVAAKAGVKTTSSGWRV